MESIPPNNILPEISNPFFGFDNKAYLWILIGILLLMLYYLRKKFNVYWTKRNKLKTMASEYERKRESRNDLKFHYYWALDRGEPKNAMSIGQQILLLDHELKELYEQYQFYKKNGYDQLKKI